MGISAAQGSTGRSVRSGSAYSKSLDGGCITTLHVANPQRARPAGPGARVVHNTRQPLALYRAVHNLPISQHIHKHVSSLLFQMHLQRVAASGDGTVLGMVHPGGRRGGWGLARLRALECGCSFIYIVYHQVALCCKCPALVAAVPACGGWSVTTCCCCAKAFAAVWTRLRKMVGLGNRDVCKYAPLAVDSYIATC